MRRHRFWIPKWLLLAFIFHERLRGVDARSDVRLSTGTSLWGIPSTSPSLAPTEAPTSTGKGYKKSKKARKTEKNVVATSFSSDPTKRHKKRHSKKTGPQDHTSEVSGETQTRPTTPTKQRKKRSTFRSELEESPRKSSVSLSNEKRAHRAGKKRKVAHSSSRRESIAEEGRSSQVHLSAKTLSAKRKLRSSESVQAHVKGPILKEQEIKQKGKQSKKRRKTGTSKISSTTIETTPTKKRKSSKKRRRVVAEINEPKVSPGEIEGGVEDKLDCVNGTDITVDSSTHIEQQTLAATTQSVSNLKIKTESDIASQDQVLDPIGSNIPEEAAPSQKMAEAKDRNATGTSMPDLEITADMETEESATVEKAEQDVSVDERTTERVEIPGNETKEQRMNEMQEESMKIQHAPLKEEEDGDKAPENKQEDPDDSIEVEATGSNIQEIAEADSTATSTVVASVEDAQATEDDDEDNNDDEGDNDANVKNESQGQQSTKSMESESDTPEVAEPHTVSSGNTDTTNADPYLEPDVVTFVGQVLHEDIDEVQAWASAESTTDPGDTPNTLNGTRGGSQSSIQESGENINNVTASSPSIKVDADTEEEVENINNVTASSPSIKVDADTEEEVVTMSQEEVSSIETAEPKLDRVALETSEDKDTDAVVSVVTWNLAEESPEEEDADFIRNFRKGSDLVLISGQECENIKPRRTEGRRSRELRRLMVKKLGKEYVPIALHLLGGIQFGLFAKRSFLKQIEDITVADVTCGIGNVFHNKGAIAAFVTLKANNSQSSNEKTRAKSLRMMFVTAHLAAHVKNFEARDADFWRISSELEAQAPDGFLPFRSGDSASNEDRSFLFDSVDRVFFCGDLNYRVDLPREITEYEVLNGDPDTTWQDLMKHDQLSHTVAEGRAFPGFAEGKLRFAPTFKFDKETGEYDTSHKQRIPAWTDRILFKPLGTRVLQYDSVPLAQHSDHRPVHGTFRVSMEGKELPPAKKRRKKKSKDGEWSKQKGGRTKE